MSGANASGSDGSTEVTPTLRVQHARLSRLAPMIMFCVAALVLAALIWMGVEGTGFPKWLLALTTVL